MTDQGHNEQGLLTDQVDAALRAFHEGEVDSFERQIASDNREGPSTTAAFFELTRRLGRGSRAEADGSHD